jgi:hypothetical protein
MNRKHLYLGVLALFLALTVVSREQAHATTGTMTITENKTLTEEHTGQIIIDEDGITLNCNGYSVVKPASPTSNCGPGNDRTCGIRIAAKTGVTVKHCYVSGSWDYGIWGYQADALTVEYSGSNANEGMRITNTYYPTLINVWGNYNSGVGFAFRNNYALYVTEYSGAIYSVAGGFDEGSTQSSSVSYLSYYTGGTYAEFTGDNGFECDFSEGIVYSGVTSSYNGMHGISIDDSPGFTVINSYANYNTKFGVSVDFGSNSGAVGYSYGTGNEGDFNMSFQDCDLYIDDDVTGLSLVDNDFTNVCDRR